MDSAWSDKALKQMGHNHGFNSGKMVDLTLKLGQPISDDDCRFGYQLGNEGTNYCSRGKATSVENKQNRANPHSGQCPTNLLPEIIRTHSGGYSNNMVSTEFVVGIPPTSHHHHHPSNCLLSIGFGHIPAASSPGGGGCGGLLLPSYEPNYTNNGYNIGGNAFKGSDAAAAARPLLPPPGNVDTSSRKRGVDVGKRCMNSKCNASDTPMWRKGPLGPKTLCNACGIKYRKEEDRRKAREAAISETKEPGSLKW